MKLKDRLKVLDSLKEKLDIQDDHLNRIVQQSVYANPWFTIEDIHLAIEAIKTEFLDSEKLLKWVNSYSIPENGKVKKIGLILAGNIPMVGFHDILSVFISGHKAMIKCSAKDNLLTPYIIQLLYEINPEVKEEISIVDQLKGFEAVIATGSNNTSRYFDYYFGKYPHIIRKNRSSVGVLTGNERPEEIEGFCTDIFTYFGLGCRNVSKLFIPQTRVHSLIEEWIQIFDRYDYLLYNPKYKANYDYNFALWTMNKSTFYQSAAVLLKEDAQISSRIGSLYFETYPSLDEVELLLNPFADEIQCVVSKEPIDNWEVIHPGEAQKPSLFDYPDQVDILAFLLKLYNS